MWITTKSIVNEIKKNQESLSEKLDIIVAEQKEYSTTFRNQLESISDRLESLENTYMAESENVGKLHTVLISGLEELKFYIGQIQGKICDAVSEQTQTFSSYVTTSVGKEAEKTIGQINASMDKVCGTVKAQTDNCERALMAEMESVKKKSDSDREKCTSGLMDSINEKIEQLERALSEKSNEIVIETKKNDNDVTEEIHSIRDLIQSVSSAATGRDVGMADNIEAMNLAMQEVMRNLLSLDEGNRLIIAKLLLKDMEI